MDLTLPVAGGQVGCSLWCVSAAVRGGRSSAQFPKPHLGSRWMDCGSNLATANRFGRESQGSMPSAKAPASQEYPLTTVRVVVSKKQVFLEIRHREKCLVFKFKKCTLSSLTVPEIKQKSHQIPELYTTGGASYGSRVVESQIWKEPQRLPNATSSHFKGSYVARKVALSREILGTASKGGVGTAVFT